MRDKIVEELREILIRDLKVDAVSVRELAASAPLFGEGLGLDSLDAVELAFLMEKNFSVTIADMEQGQQAFESLKILAEFIMEKQPAPAA